MSLSAHRLCSPPVRLESALTYLDAQLAGLAGHDNHGCVVRQAAERQVSQTRGGKVLSSIEAGELFVELLPQTNDAYR